MKLTKVTAICALALASLLVVATPNPFGEMLRINWRMRQLARSSDLQGIALACRTLLQSTSEERIFQSDNVALPPIIRSMNPHYVQVSPDRQRVLIELGGGFFHYGYILESVSSGNGRWRLMLESEYEEDYKELLRL